MMAMSKVKKRKKKHAVAKKDPREETLGDYLEDLIPGITRHNLPAWPPDAFGLTAATLHRSGAYSTIFTGSPPDRNWSLMTRDTGVSWRRAWVESSNGKMQFPDNVAKWWDTS
jgi:hypothetical protein